MSYLRKAEIKNVIQYFCNELSSQTIQKVIERCNFNEFTQHNFLWILQEILIRCLYQSCLVQLRSPRRKYGIRNHHRMMMIIFISDMKCTDIHSILISDSTPLSRLLSIIVGCTSFCSRYGLLSLGLEQFKK